MRCDLMIQHHFTLINFSEQLDVPSVEENDDSYTSSYLFLVCLNVIAGCVSCSFYSRPAVNGGIFVCF